MRTHKDARRNPIAGDELQYCWRGLTYWRSVWRLLMDARKRTVIRYEVTDLDGDTWFDECLLLSWRRWAKGPAVVVERIEQAEGGSDV